MPSIRAYTSWGLGAAAHLRRVMGTLGAFTASLLMASTAGAASPVAAQQLTVTAANATGGSVYDLTLTPNSSGTTALISTLAPLNSDGTKHGLIDALAWAPNAATGTLDLIAADLTKGQILRYSGPAYGSASVLYSYTPKAAGPSNPVGLAVDGSGNLLVISPSNPLDATPALWILPFNAATGAYGAPVLVDHNFSGVRTLALAEVLVATTPASALGTAAPAWNAGDVLVLVGDTFDSRVIVYAKAAIQNVLAHPGVPLSGPTSTVVSSKQFLNQIALPFGMDLWPADASHGVSLLVTTIDGRILRYDTKAGAFSANFASGLGLGLQKLKVGSFGGTPYAFVAQLGMNGQIYQFGAPPASGANKPLATLNKGVNAPVGLAVANAGSTPASSCVAPSACSPLGPNVTVQISGPGAGNIPAGATILQQSCTVPNDPRVTVTGGVWSCAGGTLDVANYCPGFPSTILPASICGHSGPSGAAFNVIKATAVLLDEHANDIYIQTSIDATAALPGPYDLPCQAAIGQYGPLLAFAPRSDLLSVEGSIVEDQSAPYFIDFTGLCDRSGGNTHSESMFAYGLGLNAAASGLGGGATGGLYGFVTTKFNNLHSTITDYAQQITPAAVTTTLQNYVTQSQNYFNSDHQNDVDNYSCALNSIASADVYLRNEANTSAFSYTAPATGTNNPNPSGDNNPNPAGAVDGRLANLYLTIAGDFTGVPNLTWPTTAAPPCVTLTASAATVNKGGSATLNFGPATPQFANTPLLIQPTACTLTATDGTYTTATSVGTSGSVSTGPLTKVGSYIATLECNGSNGGAASSVESLSTQTINVSAAPSLTSISVTPSAQTIATNSQIGFTATGTYSDNSTQNLTHAVTWISSNTNAASITSLGIATCLANGVTSISATSGSVTGATPLSCVTPAPTLQSLQMIPNAPQNLTAGQTTQWNVIGTYSDNSTQNLTSQATWSSSVPTAASVGNGASAGLVTALGSGTSLISAAYGSVSPASNSVTVSVPTPTASLTASPANTSPTVYPLGTGVTLSWSTTNLPNGASCALSSNATGSTVTLGTVAASGSTAVNDTVPETVTYSLTCTGIAQAATVQVTYLLRTTYQYTGKTFSSAATPYSSADRLIISMTMDSPLPANATLIDPTTQPGFQILASDGVRTSQPAGGNEYLRVSTDAGGNIIGPWTVGWLNADGALITTQYDTGAPNEGFLGTLDETYSHYVSGSTGGCQSSCGQSISPGTWTFTNLESLHVIYGTLPTASPAAQLQEVVLTPIPAGGSASAPAFSANSPSILNQVAEPTSCAAPGNPNATAGQPTAVTALAFTPNTPGGTSDVVAANGHDGDVFRLTGPSYGGSFDVNNASANCWGSGPQVAGLAADGQGNVLGVGYNTGSASSTPAVFLFPNNTAGTAQTSPNYTLLINVNDDAALVPPTCQAAQVGCVGTLVDAVVAPLATTTNGVAAGDLLILSGDAFSATSTAPLVMRIPAAGIALGASLEPTCLAGASPSVCGSALVTGASLAAVGLQPNEAAISLDVSPLDGSLLIATNQGRILQLQPTTAGYGLAQVYGTQAGLQKIRAGQRRGTLYLFGTVQQAAGSSVVLFAGAGPFSAPTLSTPTASGDLAGGLAVLGLGVGSQ